MARGTQESNKVFFKIDYENKDRDNGKPFFAEQKKVNGEWTSTGNDTYLQGILKSIKSSSYEYTKGKKKMTQHTFTVEINGGDEVYSLDLNYSYYSRSLLNSLSSVKDFSVADVKISVYRNKEDFVNLYTEVDGERTEWTIPPSKLPKKEDDKWLGSFDYFINMINDAIPNDPIEMLSESLHLETEAAINASSKSQNVEVGDDEDDDLPF
jgi:hypothetical protein